MNKNKPPRIGLLILTGGSLLALCLSYYPWLGYMISETPERILAWYPNLGGTWLLVRDFIRPVLACLSAVCIFYVFLPQLKSAGEYISGKRGDLFRSVKNAAKILSAFIKYISYTTGAVVLLFVLLNIICFYLLKKDGRYQDYHQRMHQLINKQAYYHSASQVPLDTGYLEENVIDNIQYTFLSNEEFKYYPRLESVHAPHHSRHINVVEDSNDLPNRTTLSLNCSPEKMIYSFGGSTTFGTLISDEHTWPSFLMNLYKESGTCVMVKNYGYCGHNASQATEAFLQLLRMGHRPSLAIFMDGINVGPPFDGCEYSQGIADRFAYNENGMAFYKMIYRLPFFKLFMPDGTIGEPSLEKRETTELILATDSTNNFRYANRLMENVILREKIGEMYGVKVISFLQPNIFYDYNRSYTTPLFQKAFSPNIYANYRKIYNTVQASHRFIDLSDLFREYKYPSVIDIVHYSPDFNRFLAEKISGYISIDSLHPYQFLEKESSNVAFDKDR